MLRPLELLLLLGSSLFFVINAVKLPLSASGRWFLDDDGKKFTYIGVNWPGHMEAMIPEGLSHQSIANITTKIKSLGMNSIRLTYATEMVDNIIERNSDVTVRASFIKALGEKNGVAVYAKIAANNPNINEKTTRLQVFDAVAAECAKQGIIVHLDNHISRAKWCCGGQDGNSWFGDKEFHTDKWKRGWKYMAEHTLKWSSIASFGLRNELRSPSSDQAVKGSYNWLTWNNHMRNITLDLHRINPKAITFLSGLDFDTNLSPLPVGADLGGGVKFRKSDWPKDKVALELHRYDNPQIKDCNELKQKLLSSGWNAMDEGNRLIVNSMPVVMTEFGFDQNPKSADSMYAKCLEDFFVSRQAGWMYWVLAGSYYKREGIPDHDEKWGILNHDWSQWRSSQVVQTYFKPMVAGMGSSSR